MMRGAVGLLLCSTIAACETSHICTLVGCGDGVSLEVRPAQGPFEDGGYELVIVADGQTHACSFVLPDDLPVQGSVHTIECTPPMSASLQAELICTEARGASSVSQTCAPIAGEFVLRALVQTTAPELELRIRRDDVPLLAQTLMPSYEIFQPNGPDCEPTCRQAGIEVTLP